MMPPGQGWGFLAYALMWVRGSAPWDCIAMTRTDENNPTMKPTSPNRLRSIGVDGTYFSSVKRYSCCASRNVSVRALSLLFMTKARPPKPGTIVTNEVVPSSFLRDATRSEERRVGKE